jgi:hypothetical protein
MFDFRSAVRRWFSPPQPPPPQPAPVEEQKREIPSRIPREMELGPEALRFLIESLSRQARGGSGDERNPFDASKLTPPPGVGRDGAALAMDEAAGVSQWAVEGIAGFFGPREGFIGYPELALLAQIPEYRSPARSSRLKRPGSGSSSLPRATPTRARKLRTLRANSSGLRSRAFSARSASSTGFMAAATSIWMSERTSKTATN